MPACAHNGNGVMQFCPWMGNTIGRRNYRSFVMFLIVLTFQIIVTMMFCVTRTVQALKDTASKSGATILDRLQSALIAPLMVVLLGGACTSRQSL
jgi:DHHC palmitoyltransferase